MRASALLCFAAAAFLVCCAHAARAEEGHWSGVHPYWNRAYVCSFRSPDLLTDDPDEQWGRDDGRLVSGDILHDFPRWLNEQRPQVQAALAEGRPVLLSLLFHSGWGTGLVTYSEDLSRARVANYPWLIRQLERAGFDSDRVTVTIDTCNATATSAHQLRPDLFPAGPATWEPFRLWRRANRARERMPLSEAYRRFAQQRVAEHLGGAARGSEARVEGVPFLALTHAERVQFQAHLYGQGGVIYGTPAFFNVLRLGPAPPGTLTANLLTGRLDGRVVDEFLTRNRGDFRKFRDYAFLAAAGPTPGATPAAVAAGGAVEPPRRPGEEPNHPDAESPGKSPPGPEPTN